MMSAKASWLGAAVLTLMSTTGCEIVAKIDRNQLDQGQGGSPPTTSSSSSSSSGSMAECAVPEDCADPGTECVVRTCEAGVCGTSPVDAGTPVSTQTPGDCQITFCDGKGAETTQADNMDLPVDGLECTEDLCTDGTPSNPALAANSACGAGGTLLCDGDGACVGCLIDADCGQPSDCSTPTCTTSKQCETIYTEIGTPTTTQTDGDCQQEQCDGVGGTKLVALASDVVNDGNECTQDMCDGTTPVTTNEPTGTACTTGGIACNGAGACVECLTGADCPSFVCTAQVCAAATCDDTVKNDVETDIDCGGGTCTACDLGKTCAQDSDCTSTVCSNNVCVASVCGDNRVTGAETCDDGNTAAADGCSAACATEGGYECVGEPSVCTQVCGNGTLNAGETCDDGNLTTGDGCSDVCVIETGYECAGTPSVCVVFETNCGDGIDNNGNGDIDAADSNCQMPAYFPACPAGSALHVFRSTDEASAIPYFAPDQTFLQSTIDTSGTAPGIVARASMLFNVTHPWVADVAVILEAPNATAAVAVDQVGVDGDNFTDTVLDSTCSTSITTVTEADAPFSACYSPDETFAAFTGTSGDGAWSLYVTDVFAASDDGTLDNWTLALCIAPPAACGDGSVDLGEACDDNNTADNDGCSSTCTIEAGYICTGSPSVCIEELCGDGNIVGAEACDDTNTTAGDGCSATCTIEPGYTCTGTPSVCVGPELDCNDGVDNDGDGSTDGADTDCLPAYFPACGAGQIMRIYKSTDTPLLIPDFDDDPAGTGVTSTITVPAGTGNIASGGLVLNITHAYLADVDVTLISPTNATFDVTSDNGSSGDNYINTAFHPVCPPVSGGAPPYSGCFAPEADISSLLGTPAEGAWQLNALDDEGFVTGPLENWTLVLCTSSAPPPVCGDGNVDAGEACDDTNTTGGDGCSATCTLEPDFQCLGQPSVCSPFETTCADGTDNDGDGFIDSVDDDCIVKLYFPPCAPGETRRVYRSTDPVTPIPYDPATFVSMINVTGAGTITRAAMAFNVTHPYVADVDMYLTPPGGSLLNVCTVNGAGGDNFTNTVLDSTCSPNISAVLSSNAPFSACYAPETSFAPLVGTNGDGMWALTVSDNFDILDDGTLDNWAVVLCTQ